MNHVEENKSGKESNTYKKVAKWITLIVLVCIIIGGGIFGYFTFIHKVEFNPMKYAAVSVSGYNGKAQVIVKVDNNNATVESKEEKAKMAELMAGLKFSVSKKQELKNGDTVRIELATPEADILKLGLKPTETTLEYVVSGLIGVPTTWAEIPQQEKILGMATNEIDRKKQAAIEYFANKVEAAHGRRAEISLSEVATNIYLYSNDRSCEKDSQEKINCATITVIKQFDVAVPSPFTFDVETMYFHSEVNNIYIQEDGSLSPVVYHTDLETITNDTPHGFIDLEKMEDVLYKYDYVKQ